MVWEGGEALGEDGRVAGDRLLLLIIKFAAIERSIVPLIIMNIQSILGTKIVARLS